MKNLDRHLATVLCADVKDYSRHMQSNEEVTIRNLGECRAAFDALILEHSGRIANTAGDSVVSEFSSAYNALTCAVNVQKKLIELGANQADVRLVYRIGIHLGEVISRGQDILGDTVNIAARLEGIADAEGICISSSVYDAVRNKLPYQYELLGEKQLKNIAEPVKVFKVLILSKVSGLFVIARNSSFVYKKQAVDLRRVGTELGVKYILEGSVRKGGERIRITAQLVEAATGSHVWAERYDRVLTDIFDLQDEMTRTIVKALEVRLTKNESNLIAERGTEDIKAYDLLIRGRELYNCFNKESVSQARQIFHEVIRVDPAYAYAYVFLAHTHIYDYIAGYVPYQIENLELALPFAQKAIEIDENCARAYAALGWYYIWHGQTSESIPHLLKAIALEPNNERAHCWLSYGYSALEQAEEGIKFANEALRLNPHYVVVSLHALGCAHFAKGELEKTIQFNTRALLQNPNFLPAHLFSAASHLLLGRPQEANHHAQEIRRLSSNFKVGMCNLYLTGSVTYKKLNNAITALGF